MFLDIFPKMLGQVGGQALAFMEGYEAFRFIPDRHILLRDVNVALLLHGYSGLCIVSGLSVQESTSSVNRKMRAYPRAAKWAVSGISALNRSGTAPRDQRFEVVTRRPSKYSISNLRPAMPRLPS